MDQGAKLFGQTTAKLTILVLVVVLISAAGLWAAQRFMPQGEPAATAEPQAANQAGQAEAVEQQKAGSFDESKLGKVLPVRPGGKDDHIWGDLAAPVQVIVYDDFECPFCLEYSRALERAKQEFGDRVAIVFRHYPLLDIHAYALKAAVASECAAEQGKFWEMYRQLFADNQAGRLTDPQFKEDAKTLGLDQAKFNQCLETGRYQDKVLGQMTEGKSFNVNGAPTTFVNGEIVIGANPFEDLVASDGRQIEGLKSIISRHLQK